MFICPTCMKEFKTEDIMRTHFLACWKEQHPYHQSQPAPRGEDVITREVNLDILNFFERIDKNARN